MLKRRKSWDFLIFWVKNWAMLTFFPLHIKKACDEPLISPGYTNVSKIVSWGLIEKEDCSTSKRGSLFRFLRERKIWNACHFKGNIPLSFREMNGTSKAIDRNLLSNQNQTDPRFASSLKKKGLCQWYLLTWWTSSVKKGQLHLKLMWFVYHQAKVGRDLFLKLRENLSRWSRATQCFATESVKGLVKVK